MRNKIYSLILGFLCISCSDGTDNLSQCVDNLPCREDAGIVRDSSRVDTNISQCGTDNNCIEGFGQVDYVNHYSNTNEYETMYIWDSNGRLIGNEIRAMVQARITKRRGEDISNNGNNIYSIQVNIYGYRTIDDRRFIGNISPEIARTRFRFIQTQQNSLRFICDCMNGARTCIDCSNRNICSISVSLQTTTNDRDRNNYCTLNTESRLVYTINGSFNSLSNSFFFQHNNYYVLIFFNPIARLSSGQQT